MSGEDGKQKKEFDSVISLLDQNGCLPHVAVIGSWAEYLYQQSGVIPHGTTAMRTLDIDFLVRNMRRPQPPVNIEAIAREQGYAVDKHLMLGTTKLRTDSALEIEFLIDQRGAGLEHAYKTSLGVTAQALRGLNLLRDNLMTVSYSGMAINVPTPEAYVLHKIIVNPDRKPDKAMKDRESILALVPYLNKDRYSALVSSLTKKQLARMVEFWLDVETGGGISPRERPIASAHMGSSVSNDSNNKNKANGQLDRENTSAKERE
jgi:hypothetical protein